MSSISLFFECLLFVKMFVIIFHHIHKQCFYHICMITMNAFRVIISGILFAITPPQSCMYAKHNSLFPLWTNYWIYRHFCFRGFNHETTISSLWKYNVATKFILVWDHKTFCGLISIQCDWFTVQNSLTSRCESNSKQSNTLCLISKTTNSL